MCCKLYLEVCQLCSSVFSRNHKQCDSHSDYFKNAAINQYVLVLQLDALMTALTDLHEKDPSIKSIVISQFTSLLDLIEKALRFVDYCK